MRRKLKDYYYLDNAATTYPKPECVYKAMDDCSRNLAVNAGRGLYAPAKEAATQIEQTKQELLKLVDGQAVADVVLTMSATAACNAIIGGIEFSEYDTVYVSPYEHNAIARTLYHHKKRVGFAIEELAIKEDGTLDMDRIRYQFARKRPAAVFLTHVSNVTGYILPIQEVCQLAKEQEAITVVDGSQALGLVPFRLRELEADYYIFAGHKNLYGPLGVGGFFIKYGMHLQPYFTGGTGSDSRNLNMPEGIAGLEPASHNIVAVTGLLAALRVYRDTSIEKFYEHEKNLTDVLTDKLSALQGVVLYAPPRACHIGMAAFNIEGYMAEDTGMILDEEYGIAVRTGYHCAPYIHTHLGDDVHAGVVRASLGRFSTMEDVDALVEAVKEILN